MKKFFLAGISFLIVMLLMSACSSKDKAEVEGNQGPTTEDFQDYETHLQTIVESSNTLLTKYSNILDGLYTGSATNAQFSKVLKDVLITQSSELVSDVEKYNVNTHFFELNQQLLKYINEQHQLFLDSIDQANQDKINKDNMRNKLWPLKKTIYYN